MERYHTYDLGSVQYDIVIIHGSIFIYTTIAPIDTATPNLKVVYVTRQASCLPSNIYNIS